MVNFTGCYNGDQIAPLLPYYWRLLRPQEPLARAGAKANAIHLDTPKKGKAMEDVSRKGEFSMKKVLLLEKNLAVSAALLFGSASV